jgi:hypothetical protein
MNCGGFCQSFWTMHFVEELCRHLWMILDTGYLCFGTILDNLLLVVVVAVVLQLLSTDMFLSFMLFLASLCFCREAVEPKTVDQSC